MSDIKAGDLVVVVRGHVCDIGRIATVLAIEHYQGWWCPICRAVNDDKVLSAIFRKHPGPESGAPLAWLMKIDPPALPEDVEHKEEQPA